MGIDRVATAEPAGKTSTPEVGPLKSIPKNTEPPRIQGTDREELRSPERVTVNKDGIEPASAPLVLTTMATVDWAGGGGGGAGSSSLRMVPEAVAVARDAPEGLERVTVKVSSFSTALSGLTPRVMVAEVCPGAKETVPVGSALPVKSVLLAGLAPDPATVQRAELVAEVSPLRKTVKVKGVEVDPVPSALSAEAGLMARVAGGGGGGGATSSLRMIPVAVAVLRDAPEGLERVTRKASSFSTVLSALTPRVMVAEVCPGAKETVPVGSALPVKSVLLAGLAPDPATVQRAELVAEVSPLRKTVKVKGVGVDPVPSALSAEAGLMARVAGGGAASSLVITARWEFRRISVPGVASLRIRSNASSASKVVSPATCTVTSFSVSLGKNVNTPERALPGTKSFVVVGLLPAPATAQFTDVTPLVRPVRWMVKT